MLFAWMASLSVQMATHVVNSLQNNGVVVPCHKLFVVVMESIAVLMGTPVMFRRELVVGRAKVQLCYRRYQH